MKIASITDRGLVRTNNQDYHFCDSQLGLSIVADGVGGQDHGEVASQVAVESCYQYLTKEDYLRDTKDIPNTLLASSVFANQQVIAHKEDKPAYRNMCTTLCCAHIEKKQLSFSWVGDSRIYVIDPSKSEIQLLTEDHTLYNDLVSRGEVAERYKKNILTRSVGSNLHTQVEAGSYFLSADEIVLICTDGLTDLVSDEKIVNAVVKNYPDLSLAAEALVDLAKGQGGRDNITAVLMQNS